MPLCKAITYLKTIMKFSPSIQIEHTAYYVQSIGTSINVLCIVITQEFEGTLKLDTGSLHYHNDSRNLQVAWPHIISH